MTSRYPPACMYCVHAADSSNPIYKCKAFPKGVPKPIIEGMTLHTTPYKGDNGIMFKVRNTPDDVAGFQMLYDWHKKH